MRCEKICTKCGLQKPMFEYYLRPNRWRYRNGNALYFDSACKQCRNREIAKYERIHNRERYLISDCFWFLNNSFTSKMHPSRSFVTQKSKTFGHRLLKHHCPRCGSVTHSRDGAPCLKCRAEQIQYSNNRLIEENRLQALKNADNHTAMLLDCSKHGTCDILAAHHEIMENDPERLSTQFLVKLICKKDYRPGSVTKVSMRKGRKNPRER